MARISDKVSLILGQLHRDKWQRKQRYLVWFHEMAISA